MWQRVIRSIIQCPLFSSLLFPDLNFLSSPLSLSLRCSRPPELLLHSPHTPFSTPFSPQFHLILRFDSHNLCFSIAFSISYRFPAPLCSSFPPFAAEVRFSFFPFLEWIPFELFLGLGTAFPFRPRGFQFCDFDWCV